MRNIEDITKFIFVENQLEKSDVIFIPGGSYAELGEKAAELWKGGYAPLIIPSGKYGYSKDSFSGPKSKTQKYTGEYQTEWEFLKDVLIKNGVEEKYILKEDCAEHTYDNGFKSKDLTDKMDIKVERGIICCKSYHARRCLMYYQWAYPEAELLICPVDIKGIKKENWFKNEKGTKIIMNEVEKVGNQFMGYIRRYYE